MDISSYLLYLSISLVASVSLGPSVLLAASNGLNYGRRKALAGVAGHVSAIFVLALISASGLGAILVASETAFMVIKYAGAAYLIYIGMAIWRSKGKWSLQIASTSKPPSKALFKQSFTLGLSNPKALVFFSALFPQFIQANAPLWPQFLLLTGTSLCNAFIFTYAYALLAFGCKKHLIKAVNSGWLGRITGSLFIGFAAVLATSR